MQPANRTITTGSSSSDRTVKPGDDVIKADPSAGNLTLQGPKVSGLGSVGECFTFDLSAMAATDGAHTVTFTPQAGHTGGLTLTAPGTVTLRLYGAIWTQI